jgi:hypothetical protein
MSDAPVDRYRSLHWIVVVLAIGAVLVNVYGAIWRPDAHVTARSFMMPVGILLLGLAGLAGARWPSLRVALFASSLLLLAGALLTMGRG